MLDDFDLLDDLNVLNIFSSIANTTIERFSGLVVNSKIYGKYTLEDKNIYQSEAPLYSREETSRQLKTFNIV